MLGTTLRQIIIDALYLYRLPASANAVELLLMIAAHESGGFTYCRQIKGPALGLYQMEPATFYAIQAYIKRVNRYPLLDIQATPERLIFDIPFATAMARVFLLRTPEPIPETSNPKALAQYAKQHWNTDRGKATVQQYLTAYLTYADLSKKPLPKVTYAGACT